MTLTAPDGEEFRGLLVQSRLASDMMTRVGEFVVNDQNTQLRPCNGGNTPVSEWHNIRNTEPTARSHITACSLCVCRYMESVYMFSRFHEPCIACVSSFIAYMRNEVVLLYMYIYSPCEFAYLLYLWYHLYYFRMG